MKGMVWDGWGIATVALLLAGLFIAYRLTWRLAYLSESLIIGLARTGLHGWARRLLRVLIGYNRRTYAASRFIIWNQVPVRFFMLWCSLLAWTGFVLLARLPWLVWAIPVGLYIGYRVGTAWLARTTPPIDTQAPELRELIQQVNERQTIPPIRRHGPPIRQWDYLDELFDSAEP
jgi:hypothetical protein